MAQLAGKVAVILGASSKGGLGEGIAKLFAAEGAKLVLGGRRKEPLEELAKELGGTAVACDIADEAQIKAMMDAATSTYGGVHIAVNAAGMNASGPIAELSKETLQSFADAHFIGPVLFIKHAAAAMKEGGSIMTLSSLTVELPSPGMTAYAATKAATDKAVQIAAVEYGGAGIRVNSLSPGLTQTPMTDMFFGIPTVIEAFKKETPIGQMPTVENVAYAALYLASDACVATGDLIRVSGGQHLRRIPTQQEMMGG